LGHAKVGDLEDAYRFTSHNDHHAIDPAAEHINGEGLPNGFEKGHSTVKSQDKKISSRTDLHQVLYQLLEAGFIARVHQRTFYSAADRDNEAETIVKRTEFKDGKTTGPKARARFLASINLKKRKWQEEEDELPREFVQLGSSKASNNRPQKRLKENGILVNGLDGHAHPTLDGPTITLQVSSSATRTLYVQKS